MVDYRLFARGALTAAGMAGSLLLTGGTAEAQFFGWWNEPTAPAYGAPPAAMMPPSEIYRIVESRGYQVTSGVRVYTVDVIDRWGRPLRLVVDAYEGDIVQSFATRVQRPAAPIPQSQSQIGELFAPPAPGAYPPYPGTAPAARGPRVIPGLGQPAQTEHRKSTRKTQTATRETGRAEQPTTSHPATARTEAEPSTHDSGVPKASTVRPATNAATAPARDDKVTASTADAPAAAKPAAPAAPAPKPAAPKTGPGYANGVPINPLD